MRTLNYFLSTNITMGEGELKNLNEHITALGSKTPIMIVDKSLEESEYLNDIIEIVKSKYKNLLIINNDLDGEPTYDYLEQKRNEVASFNPDLIIGIGGGSTMDIGKGVALLLTNNRPALELKGFPENVNDPIPLMTIPSIFGSGSEVSYNAVFIDQNEGRKLGINTRKNFPKRTLIDPLLTMSAPENIVISSAMDTLVHCVDSFGSNKSNPFSKMFSIEGFKRSFNTLLYEDIYIPNNRINLAIGSICGIIALMNSGDGPTNGLAYYFGVKNKIPHGLAGGIFLKDVMSWNHNNGYNEYHKFINSDVDSNSILFNRFEELYLKYKIPRLSDYGYGKEDINRLAKNVSSALEGSFSGNPIPFNLQSVKEILKTQLN